MHPTDPHVWSPCLGSIPWITFETGPAASSLAVPPGEMAGLLWSSILWTPEAWDQLGGGHFGSWNFGDGPMNGPRNGLWIMATWRFYIVAFLILSWFSCNMFRQTRMFPSNHDSWQNVRRLVSFFPGPKRQTDNLQWFPFIILGKINHPKIQIQHIMMNHES